MMYFPLLNDPGIPIETLKPKVQELMYILRIVNTELKSTATCIGRDAGRSLC